MKKIPITKIDPDVFHLRGIAEGSFSKCLESPCGRSKGDGCCWWGVSVDRESYGLMKKHQKRLDAFLPVPLDECFEGTNDDPEFLGGGAIDTKVRKDHWCALHHTDKRGCALVDFVFKNGLPHRMIPSACRIYPLTWERGKLKVAKTIYKNCHCLLDQHTVDESFFESHRKELEDIFAIDPQAIERAKKEAVAGGPKHKALVSVKRATPGAALPRDEQPQQSDVKKTVEVARP